MKLAVVIPTRHRSELAIAAIESLLAQRDAALSIVVSDNSTEESHVQRLHQFCSASADPRLLYVRPPHPMAMAAHWDWALGQAMERTSATHFGIHYDRKLWKQGSIARLAAACAREPECVVTHPCDFTFARPDGFVAWQFPVSGKLYAIESQQVIAATARGTISEMGQALPLLSNCMVPRPILERIRHDFGTICDSTAPDTAFTFRLCSFADRYLHFDEALSVMYAFRYSNGQAYFRRDTTGTFGDFMRFHSEDPWLDAAPIPGLTLGLNVIFHEYNLVRRHVGGHRFPPPETAGYLRELALGLDYITDSAERSRLREILQQHGWREDPPPAPPPQPQRRPLWRRLASRLVRPFRARRRAEVSVASPQQASPPVFATEQEAVDFLLTDRIPFSEKNPLLEIVAAAPIA